MLALVLVGVFSHPSAEAGSYISMGMTAAGNPAQNPRIFCVTDMPYSVTPNSTTASGANTTQINKAINDCIKAGGGVVYFPPGNYYVNATINVLPTFIDTVPVPSVTYVNNGVILMGAGAEATGIFADPSFTPNPNPAPNSTPGDTALISIGVQTSAGNTKSVTITTGISNCWVRDMSLHTVYFNGTTPIVPTAPVTIGTVLEFSYASTSGCENVHTYNQYNGIWFNGFGDCSVSRCRSSIPGKINNNDLAHPIAGLGSGLRLNGYITGTTAGTNSSADLWVGGGCQFAANTNGIYIAGGAGGVHIEDSDIGTNSYGIIIEAPGPQTMGETYDDRYRNREVVIGHCAIDSSVNEGIYVKIRALRTLRLLGTWCSSNGLSGAVAPNPTPTSPITTNGLEVVTPQITTDLTTPTTNRLAINIADCRFYRNGGHGLVVSAAQSLNVVGSTFDYNGAYTNSANTPPTMNGHGVYVADKGVLSSTITGNTLIKNGTGGGISSLSSTFGAGICLDFAVSNVLATGNNTLDNLYSTGGVNGAGVQLNTGTGTAGTNRLLSVGTATPAPLNL